MPGPTVESEGGGMTRNGCAARRCFRIWVDGRLSEHFAAGMPGMEQRDEEGGTVLSGAYVDESHLRGVLDRLSDLGIGIRRLEVDDAEPTTAARQPDVSTQDPEATT